MGELSVAFDSVGFLCARASSSGSTEAPGICRTPAVSQQPLPHAGMLQGLLNFSLDFSCASPHPQTLP